MNTTQTISTILLIVFLPVALAVWDDKDGDSHPNNDLWIIGIFMFMLSTWLMIGDPSLLMLIKNMVVGITGFALFFPFIVNFVHYKRGVTKSSNWWSHLSSKAWPDRLFLKYDIGWAMRLVLYLILFIIALLFRVF